MGTGSLPAKERRALRRQRSVARATAPLWVPAATALMRFGLGWRIEDTEELRELRRLYARLRRERETPLLVCANHLTMVDSFLVARALGGSLFFLRDFDALPWNVPERANFASTWWSRLGVYLMKCIPVSRGASRREVAAVLARVRALLEEGQVALVFPEGGRSRSGRVEVDNAAYGVGRIVGSFPDCRVLCVYLRGEGQESWSDFPRRGERFRVHASLLEPKTDHSGLRGSLDLSRQIVSRLAELERRHARRSRAESDGQASGEAPG